MQVKSLILTALLASCDNIDIPRQTHSPVGQTASPAEAYQQEVVVRKDGDSCLDMTGKGRCFTDSGKLQTIIDPMGEMEDDYEP